MCTYLSTMLCEKMNRISKIDASHISPLNRSLVAIRKVFCLGSALRLSLNFCPTHAREVGPQKMLNVDMLALGLQRFRESESPRVDSFGILAGITPE